MRVPLSWLAEFVDLAQATPAGIMEQLVRVGIEEEAAIGGDISGPVVVGQVLEFQDEPQSNGKTIRWCQVRVAPDGSKAADGGAAIRGIVCGANNFISDDKVVVALPGSVLSGGFSIGARKTYGHISDGMIASSKELGLGDDHAGILRLATINLNPQPGTDAIELLGLGESAAEVNVTPDRGYCLSIRGIAREYSHATGNKFTDPASKVKPLVGSGFSLLIDDKAPLHSVPGSSSFVLLAVEGVNATAASPSWMVNRLKLAGMRSISIAVDITNYVMLELGQPLHAYDLDKLSGGITVRRAMPKEVIVTLDGKERTMHEEDLLICDDSGPIGIAGVMGGASTEVSDSSTRLLLEAAIFDPISIARTARRHKLSSEASRRFERGVDPQVSAVAAHRAAKLLEELAGGKISKLGANYAKVSPPLPIELPVSFPAALVGYDFQEKQVVDALELVGCELKMNSGTLLVQPPSWRPDLTDKTDLVEEVARLVGYSKIPATLPVAPPGTGLTKDQRLRRSVLNNLVGAGMVEVLNYPFVSSEQNQIFSAGNAVILENPLQLEFAEMRKDLLPGLMSAASRNLSRGMADLALIEEGSVFLLSANKPVTQLPAGNKRPSAEQLAQLNASIPHQPRHLAGLFLGQWLSQSPTSNSSESGYPQALSAVAAVARLLGLQIDISQEEVAGLHPGRGARLLVAGQVVGLAGELHPELAQANYLPRRVGVFEVDFSALCSLAPEVVAARQIRVMPALTQDLSLVVDQSVTAAELLRTIADACSELLESIRLVDQYQGEGIGATKKSLTFTLLFRSGEKTLTQAEANQLKLQAVEKCKAKFGAELRA